jgi:hypothetical protein
MLLRQKFRTAAGGDKMNSLQVYLSGSLRPAMFLSFWFFCNACVVISNKYLFSVYKFKFPFIVRGPVRNCLGLEPI